MPSNLPALQQFIQGEIGGSFEVLVKTVTVNTSPTKILSHNYERLSAVVVNLSTSQVTLSTKSNVAPGTGILLTNTSSSLTLKARDDFALVGSDMYGVVSTGSADVYVLEVVRYSTEA